MKIRYVFYKAKIDGKPLDNLISTWTKILAVLRCDFKAVKYNYSHVEEWEPGWDGDFIYEFSLGNRLFSTPTKTGFTGQCFSSTMRGKSEGVRFAPANEVLWHPERWDYIEIDVPDKEFKNLRTWMEDLVGLPYDFSGIAGFALPLYWNAPEKWYCSEVCAALAWYLRILPKLHNRISPRRFAKLLAEKHGEPKPLK